MDSLISFFWLSTLFLVVGATSDASSTINSYWKEVFPRTPMPNPIRALLPSSPGSSHFHIGQTDLAKYWGWGRRWGVFRQEHDMSKGNWSPNLAPLYFLREDLQPGSRMKVTMMVSPVIDGSGGGIDLEPTFLPRQQAQELPFSTSNLTAILAMFSIEPDSDRASLTRQTLVDCEVPPLKREVKYCATSLESMIDFVVAELGSSEIHAAVTSVVNKEEEVIKPRTYRVGDGGGKVMSTKVVACHNVMFPFAVFYCHKIGETRPYMVPLVADDGSRVNAIALCHFDTSSWNPGHASFQLLGVKPGTVPICHFIIKDLAWVPN